QFALLLAVELRRRGLAAVTGGNKGFQSGIQADGVGGLCRSNFGGIEVADERNGPLAACFLLDGRRLYVTLHCAMQDHRHTPDLWDVDTLAFDTNPLGETKSVR